jgi:LPS export ABC transporter protein LptC
LILFLALPFTACSDLTPGGPVEEGASLLTGVKVYEVKNNRFRWKLVSASARFEDGETRVYFDTPKVLLYDDEALSSELQAETGFLNMAAKEAQLERNVIVTSKKDGMTLLTSRLFFSSKKDRIWTDDPVVIHKGDTITHGRGFTAKPDLSEIEITRQETKTRRDAPGRKNNGGR